ncbi:hypothetical protein GCM10010234_10150 [Streptomyces hawaiiensis]
MVEARLPRRFRASGEAARAGQFFQETAGPRVHKRGFSRSAVGVVIAPYAVVRDDLERGQLVAPFGFVPDGTSYPLLSCHSPEQDGRVRRLMAWLRAKTSWLENDSEPGDRWA